MTTYYCDLGEGTFADRSGADSTTNVLTGPAGLQAAIRGTGNATALAAGDTLYVKGTGDLSRLVLIDTNSTDVTGWGIGDNVRNYDGSGDDWTGVVVETNADGNLAADDKVLVWLASGKSTADIATADGIENTDAGGGAGDPTSVDPITSDTPIGIIVDGNAGTLADGYIKVVGVNSSWTEDGTRAVLQGGDENRRGIDSKVHRLWLQNLELTAFDGSTIYPALYLNTGSSDHAHFINIYINGSARCVTSASGSYVSWINCVFEGGDYGVFGPGAMSCFRYCKFDGCTNTGLDAGNGELQVIDCLFIGCAKGIYMDDDVAIHGCTFVGDPDTPAGIGVDLTYGGMAVMVGCRFTYLATGVSIDSSDSRPAFMYCYFGGNTADLGGTGSSQYDAISIDGTTTLTLAGSDTNHGYEDPSSGDYNLASGATYRSVALEID